MTTFTLTIQCDNAAFSCGETGKFSHVNGRIEINRMLYVVRSDLYNGNRDSGPIRDTNGNRVGEWRITEGEG